jgi:hypothetical protein
MFDKTAVNIRVSSKASSIFIQTDRPIYKPGDKGTTIYINKWWKFKIFIISIFWPKLYHCVCTIIILVLFWGLRGRDCMIVEFTTTCAIRVYQH